MSHRLAALALGLGGCTLLFPFQGKEPSGQDAGAADAARDAPADAFDPGPCPDRPLEDRHPEDCLGCGDPCGPRRPFCCGAECCADECGSPDNECSREPEPRPDAGGDADADADADGDADGCDHTVYESCRGCGQPCDATRPFCCIGICCSEECGAVPNDCSRLL